MDTCLERIRRAELEPLRSWLPPHARILEIGGGSGFQAAILASWGHDVVSIDISVPASAGYFPVRQYDGKHFPFRDEEFDVVFSSHMLYLIDPPADFLREIQRVLTHSGLAVHVVTSATWRLWTSVSHYADVARVLTRKATRRTDRPSFQDTCSTSAAVPSRQPFRRRLQRVLIPAPIGPAPSACAELWKFRRARWLAAFREAGYDTITCVPNRLFFTGYALMPSLSVQRRRRLAQVLGSSALYVGMRKP